MSDELSAYPPDGFELRLIRPYVDLRGKRVLEIGCGDGRLSFQIAPLASWVFAIDADAPSIDDARQEQTRRGVRNIEFQASSVEELPTRGAPFDAALFSWSL